MEKITIDEENRKRIQKYLKQSITVYGYEEDIALLEQKNQLTEELARKIFTEIMERADSIRTVGLDEREDGEFKEMIATTFAKYDSIPKPEQYEQYGIYDGSYSNMEFQEIYNNMQIAFEMQEVDNLYYGCRDLRNIANTVINSIDGIEKYNIELPEKSKEELQTIQEELRELLSEDKTNIEAIQERVNSYNEYATGIWNEYLTDIDDSKSSEYRWIIHNLTKGELEGDFRDKYMSTSLITNNTMGVYGNSRYGLVIKPKHIVSASYKDTYTLNTRQDDEELFNVRPPLMLPQEIEDICVRQTIEANGEMLNYSEDSTYSEMVIDEYEIQGVYYISNGEQELAKDYSRAKKVAEERGLPLIERDISKYREEHGLEPIAEKDRIAFCKNILWKCCDGDRELQNLYYKYGDRFASEKFQEFYEKYIELKQTGEFSKSSILKTFAKVARDDNVFSKVSLKIDDMYMTLEEKESLRIMQEYGITGITDKENLQKRLEYTISNGIMYGSSQSEYGDKKFAEIKQVLPQFETFKDVYLQLRQYGIEDKLYEGLDFRNISYEELLKRAKTIIEEKFKKEELQQTGQAEQEQLNAEQTGNIDVENDAIINEYGEFIRTNNNDKTTEIKIVEEQLEENKVIKKREVPQQENVKPKEESIKDEIGDKTDKENNPQMQEKKTTEVNLWLNRFSSWYSAINRVSQSVKAKFIKMKSDIGSVISTKIKERDTMEKKQNNIER